MAENNQSGDSAMETRRAKHRAAALEGRRRVRPLLRPAMGVPSAPRKFPAGAPAIGPARNGTPTDVMLQGFHSTSRNSQNPNWYQIVAQNAGVIKKGGLDVVWFRPPSQAAFD